MSKKYIGYIRVSTFKQKEGHSLEYQKEAIKNYCKAYNIELNKKIYTDAGISAYKERKQFNLMKERLLNDDDIHGVIVYDLTRFGRSTIDMLQQILEINEAGKDFISIKEKFDIGTKTGKLLLTVLSAIADYERETIKERMEAGKEYAKIHGTKSGKPLHKPFKKLDFNLIRKYRDEPYKMSWRKIAKIHGNVSAVCLMKRAKKEGIE